MVRQVTALIAFLLASAPASAGLPPTFTKVSTDSVPLFTTSIDFSSLFQGTHSGPKLTLVNFIGNAATATSLFTTPTQCTGSQFATGIAANGNANCATPSAGTGSPGGSTKQVQYNSAGVFGGADQMTWDSTNHRLTLGDGTTGIISSPAVLESWTTGNRYHILKNSSVESIWGVDSSALFGTISANDLTIRTANVNREIIYGGGSAGREDLSFTDVRYTANGTVKWGASSLMALDSTNNYFSIGNSALDTPLHIGGGSTTGWPSSTSLGISYADTAQHGIGLKNNNVQAFEIVDSTQFTLGTINATPMVIRTGNSDRLTIDGSGNIKIPGGTNQQILAQNSSGALQYQDQDERRNFFSMVEEFVGSTIAGSLGWTCVASGTGASCTSGNFATIDAAHPGVAVLQTGTTTTGSAHIYTGTGQFLFTVVSGAKYYQEFMFQTSALSTVTDTYTVRFGFADATTATTPVDGIEWSYTNGTNSGNLVVTPYSNSVAGTALNTTQAFATGWHRYGILVDCGASTAQAFYDGTSLGTLSSGLPTGAGRYTGLNAQIVKSAGTTNTTMSIDWVKVNGNFTTARSN